MITFDNQWHSNLGLKPINPYDTKKIDETVTISVEQYSGKKLQLNLLGAKYFLINFIN